MKRTHSKNWFEVLKKRIQMFRKGHLTSTEAQNMIGSKIEWCWKFKRISDTEKDLLVDEYMLALQGW